jgi:hypothetical protein
VAGQNTQAVSTCHGSVHLIGGVGRVPAARAIPSWAFRLDRVFDLLQLELRAASCWIKSIMGEIITNTSINRQIDITA